MGAQRMAERKGWTGLLFWITTIVAAAIVGFVLTKQSTRSSTASTTFKSESELRLKVRDVYTERTGRKIGDGYYPMEHIVQVHLETSFSVSEARHWTVRRQ